MQSSSGCWDWRRRLRRRWLRRERCWDPLEGPLKELPVFRETQIIARRRTVRQVRLQEYPAICKPAAYISSGTWSLVGTVTETSVTTQHAFDAGYTNIGAAAGGLLFHSLINSMWLLKQCMDSWAAVTPGTMTASMNSCSPT